MQGEGPQCETKRKSASLSDAGAVGRRANGRRARGSGRVWALWALVCATKLVHQAQSPTTAPGHLLDDKQERIAAWRWRSSNQDSDSIADNYALPLSTNVAVIMVGRFFRGITEDSIDSLVSSAMVGQSSSMHFFLHVEPTWTEGSHKEAVEYIQGVCEKAMGDRLNGLVIRDEGTLIGNMIHKQARQFNRLRDAYELVLGQESLEGSRYTHVIRTRTDIVFAFPWHIGVDQLLAAVPDGKVAGPAWGCRERPPNTCLVFSDQFWISSRSRSWLTFVVHPFTFSNSPTVEKMVSALRCKEGVSPSADSLPLSSATSHDRDAGGRACSAQYMPIDNVKQTSTRALHSSFLMERVEDHDLLDSCALTGPWILLRPSTDNLTVDVTTRYCPPEQQSL